MITPTRSVFETLFAPKNNISAQRDSWLGRGCQLLLTSLPLPSAPPSHAACIEYAHMVHLCGEASSRALTWRAHSHTQVHPQLRSEADWKGYWIDAASALRMKEDAIIILDPCNRAVIDQGLKDGVKDYIGGNCTVSLMLMGLGLSRPPTTTT